MLFKNAIHPWRGSDLTLVVPFGISTKVLTCQLAILLVCSSLLLNYCLPSNQTQTYASATEEILRQGIPKGRISGASR